MIKYQSCEVFEGINNVRQRCCVAMLLTEFASQLNRTYFNFSQNSRIVYSCISNRGCAINLTIVYNNEKSVAISHAVKFFCSEKKRKAISDGNKRIWLQPIKF